MGNSIYPQIQKAYGKDGIDYVAFRYHQRRSYQHVKQLINQIKQKMNKDQKTDLQYIQSEKNNLTLQFTKAKNQAESLKKGSISQAEAMTKRKVQEFSGYNEELRKLENLITKIKDRYEAQKTAVEKKLREDIMKIQNKSGKRSIKEFDNKSNEQRKKIQNQCIKKHPDRAQIDNTNEIEKTISCYNYKLGFQGIENKQRVKSEAEAGRKSVRNNILPNKAPICC